MIIESLHISGFGIFQDTGVDSLGDGLTVIYAPNGLGKTTLRDFLRAALFGFQSKDNRYEPVNTTAHGGLLRVRDKNGQAYSVQLDINKGRAQSRVKLPDGQEGPSLGTLLNFASPAIFRNVFTIGLSELQDAKRFNDNDEIQLMIGAFAGEDSGQSFLKWRNTLESEQGELFKPGGKNPLLNRKLAEVEKLQAQLKILQSEAEKYWGYERELMELAQVVDEVGEQRLAVTRKLNHLENLKKAWPDWVSLCLVRQEQDQLQLQITSFPLQGLEKLEKLQERQQQQQARVKEHREAQEHCRELLKGVQVNQLLLEQALALDEAWEKLALYQENKKRLTEFERRIALLENELSSKLAELGSDWTLERALGFKDDVTTRTEKSEIARALAESRQELKQATQELEQARRNAQKSREEYCRLKAAFSAQWQSPPPDEATLDQFQGVLIKCRSLSQEQNRTQSDIKKNAEAIEECLQQLRRLEEQAASAQPISKANPAFLLAGVGVLAGTLILAVFFRENLPVMTASLIAGVVGALLCWWLAKQQAATPAVGNTYFTEQTKHQQEKKVRLEGEQAALQANLDKLQTELKRQGEILGLTSYSEAAYDAHDGTLKKQRQARRQFEREQTAVLAAHVQAKRDQEHVEELQVRWSNKERLYLAVEQRWRQWLHRQGLAETLTVEVAEVTVEQLKKISEIHTAHKEQTHAAHNLNLQINEYEQNCQDLFDALQLSSLVRDELERELRRLRNERDAEMEKAKQRLQLQEKLQKGEQAVPVLREEGRKLVQELKDLLAKGGAQDESEFVTRAQAWQKRHELQETEKNLLSRLQILSAPGEALERLQAELANLDHEALQIRLEEAEHEAVAVNEEFKQLNQRLGELQEARRRLASNDEVGLCAQRLEQARSELQELAGQWAVRRLAFRLMEKARHKFETERQPAVLQSAGEALKVMSGGRYEGIMRPLGSSESHLVQSNGELRAKEKIWNTALKEKVYLSLRFGLIETYNGRLEPLPVVLDDALVNLDPRNMRGAAKAILQLAQKQQIIYLTCHPHTVEHFAAHDATLPVYEITEQAQFVLRK